MTNDQFDLGDIKYISSKPVSLASLGNNAENHFIHDACDERMVEYDQNEDFELYLKYKQHKSWFQHAPVGEIYGENILKSIKLPSR